MRVDAYLCRKSAAAGPSICPSFLRPQSFFPWLGISLGFAHRGKCVTFHAVVFNVCRLSLSIVDRSFNTAPYPNPIRPNSVMQDSVTLLPLPRLPVAPCQPCRGPRPRVAEHDTTAPSPSWCLRSTRHAGDTGSHGGQKHVRPKGGRWQQLSLLSLCLRANAENSMDTLFSTRWAGWGKPDTRWQNMVPRPPCDPAGRITGYR